MGGEFMLKITGIDKTCCPICGIDTYISKDDYACSDTECVFAIGNKAYMEKFSLEDYMQHQIDSYNKDNLTK
jgi:hypothetical protein